MREGAIYQGECCVNFRNSTIFFGRFTDTYRAMTDLISRTPEYPQRIVSVVPSQTELLFDLGLDAEIVGRTRYCIYPADRVAGRTVVGGTKDLNLDLIDTLRPDLILANKEENDREQIETLARRYPVHVTDMATLTDALQMIGTVGKLVGKAGEATQLVSRISRSMPPPITPTLRVVYLIWRKPYMAATSHTFIHDMLRVAGFQNSLADQTRYPVLTADDLRDARPDLIFLSSEPYPFAEKHRAEFNAICPNARVMLVDGELFSWYGSRLLQSGPYFADIQRQLTPL